jgi:hypothetical protein
VLTRSQRTAFDIDEFYSALDAERSARGLTWLRVTREINSLFRDVPARPISPSTLTGMRGRRAIEGNGVLQMLVWLGRTPESFTSARDRVPHQDEILPRLGPSRILRFDTPAIFAALDAQRAERGMMWREVAAEIGGVTAASLTRLAQGGRVGFPDVMRIVEWLGRPVASFTRGFGR